LNKLCLSSEIDLFCSKKYLRKTEASRLAPIAAVSFLWSETEQITLNLPNVFLLFNRSN